MLPSTIEQSPKWTSLQEPRCASNLPNSFLKLLSALDQGWDVIEYTLHPSWDQTGFVYVITVRQPFSMHTEEIVLPRNESLFEVLERNGIAV
jgi:hypothetical protein